MIQIVDSLGLRSSKPNFARDWYANLTLMKAVTDDVIDDGHIAYCASTKLHYEYLYSNSVDDRTGKWREYKPVDGVLSSTSENAVQNKVLYQTIQDVRELYNALKVEVDKIDTTMDDALSDTSVKGVQNRVLKKEFDILGGQVASLENNLKNYIKWQEVDTEVKEDSPNPVASGAIFTELNEITVAVASLKTRMDKVEPADDSFSNTSVKPVQNKVITAKIAEITSTLTQLGIQASTALTRLDKVEPLDAYLNETSERPVQNKAVTLKLKELEEVMYYAAAPEITFTADKYVIPTNTPTAVKLSWTVMRAGEDITSQCDFEINGVSASQATHTKDETLTELNYKVLTRNLTVTFGGHKYGASLEIVASPLSYAGVMGAVNNSNEGPTVTEVQALTTSLIGRKEAEYVAVNLNSQIFVYAYPQALGELSSIQDQNGFEYLRPNDDGGFGYTDAVIGGIDYHIYWLKTIATGKDLKFRFS